LRNWEQLYIQRLRTSRAPRTQEEMMATFHASLALSTRRRQALFWASAYVRCGSAWNKGSDTLSVQLAHHAGATRRARRRSSLARPYIWRFTSLSFVSSCQKGAWRHEPRPAAPSGQAPRNCLFLGLFPDSHLGGRLGMTKKAADQLRAQAQRCRRLANLTTDCEVSRRLLELAEEFETRADVEEAEGAPK